MREMVIMDFPQKIFKKMRHGDFCRVPYINRESFEGRVDIDYPEFATGRRKTVFNFSTVVFRGSDR